MSEELISRLPAGWSVKHLDDGRIAVEKAGLGGCVASAGEHCSIAGNVLHELVCDLLALQPAAQPVAHTDGEWQVYVEPTPTKDDAKRELCSLVDGTPNFAGHLVMITTPQGLAPAVTGCGADSLKNAHAICVAMNAAPPAAALHPLDDLLEPPTSPAPREPAAVPDGIASIVERMAAHMENYSNEPPITWGLKGFRLINEARALLAAAPSAPAVPVGDGLPDAVALAYGLLWHVNAGMDAPMDVRPPSLTPEKAAHEARKLLRDLMTSAQRGDGINAARDMLASLPAAPAATKGA